MIIFKSWFIFYLRIGQYLERMQVKFLYEGHQINVKVTGARQHEIPYSHIVKLLPKLDCDKTEERSVQIFIPYKISE